MKTILTGIRPTGNLHLGHLFGAGQNWVKLQDDYDFYLEIADVQALTDNFNDPQKVRDNVDNIVKDLLSVGIDPKKVHIFIQSRIPEIAELTVFYSNLVTVARLQRNPTVKTEISQKKELFGNQGESITYGFLGYPVSQAADITCFNGELVPVGEDQEPLLEQCREIVRKFNSVYGETLIEPEILLPESEAARRLPGTDGKAKMSKSLGNCIYLADSEEDVRAKIMSMYTDPDHIKVSDPGKIEGNTVFTYLDAFSKTEQFERYLPEYANLDELKEHYQKGGLGDVKVKKFLNKVLQEELEPIRARRHEYEKDIAGVYDILKKGSEEARQVAANTLHDIKEAMKINYFDDAELIAKHAKKYGN